MILKFINDIKIKKNKLKLKTQNDTNFLNNLNKDDYIDNIDLLYDNNQQIGGIDNKDIFNKYIKYKNYMKKNNLKDEFINDYLNDEFIDEFKNNKLNNNDDNKDDNNEFKFNLLNYNKYLLIKYTNKENDDNEKNNEKIINEMNRIKEIIQNYKINKEKNDEFKNFQNILPHENKDSLEKKIILKNFLYNNNI